MSETPMCECWWTPPETWLSAASCGYGSGYEPGSQTEWNPDCPMHRPTPPTAPLTPEQPPADHGDGTGYHNDGDDFGPGCDQMGLPT